MTQPDRRTASPVPHRPSTRTKPRLTDRLTVNVVAGLVASLLAFVLVGSILRDRRAMVTVAVANDRIPQASRSHRQWFVRSRCPRQSRLRTHSCDSIASAPSRSLRRERCSPANPFQRRLSVTLANLVLVSCRTRSGQYREFDHAECVIPVVRQAPRKGSRSWSLGGSTLRRQATPLSPSQQPGAPEHRRQDRQRQRRVSCVRR
jgi:hypothetical protein